MHEEEYYEWATSRASTRITKAEAKANWAMWIGQLLKNPKSIIHDHKGPRDSPRRIRVSISDKVTLRSRYTKAKEFSTSRAQNKKVTEEDVQKGHAEIFKGHESMVAGDAEDDDGGPGLTNIAHRMVNAGASCSAACGEDDEPTAGGAFDGAGCNVKDLMQEYEDSNDDEEKSEGQDAQAPSDAGEDDGEKPGVKGNKSKKAAGTSFNREDAIVSAQRGWTEKVANLAAALAEVEEKAVQALLEAEPHKTSLKNPWILCAQRHDATKRVQSSDPAQIIQYITAIERGTAPLPKPPGVAPTAPPPASGVAAGSAVGNSISDIDYAGLIFSTIKLYRERCSPQPTHEYLGTHAYIYIYIYI